MQRVAIARALVRSPKAIFADEPTGNLDSYNSENVYNMLRKLSHDILVVIVTHDVAIANWADRVITLVDGVVCGDIDNKPLDIVTVARDARGQEDDEIDNIIQVLKIKNKGTKIGTNAVFSHKNSKSYTRKKVGLSSKSSLGLSVALINKDIVKKVCVLMVIVILTGLLILSASMAFATPEKTMVNAMRRNKDNLFAITPIIEGGDYRINSKDLQYVDKLFLSAGVKTYEIASGELIASNWGNIEPILAENAVQSAYFGLVNFERMSNAIYTDAPAELGLEMVLGRSPVEANEIAVSQTYYEYMLNYEEFGVTVSGDDYLLRFDKDSVLGRKIEPFDVVISGVFNDKNGLDKSLKNKDIASIVDEVEMKKLEENLSAEHKQNALIDLVIKPISSYSERVSFAGVGGDFKIGAENALTANDKYFDYLPLNNTVRNYYSEGNLSKIELLPGEIIMDSMTLGYFNRYYGKNFQQGSIIKLNMCEMTSKHDLTYPKSVRDSKDFVIKSVINFDGINNAIVMSQEDYSQRIYGGKMSNRRLISGEISPLQLAKINKEYSKYISGVAGDDAKAYINYSIRNCPVGGVTELSFISITNKFIAVPLLILSVLVGIAMIMIFYSDVVKTKAKELLILRPLGTKTNDLVKIYSIFSIVLLAVQIALGSIFGGLLVSMFNLFGASVSGFVQSFNIFYVDAASLSLSIVMIIIINAVALVASLLTVSSKNLRKAFQKIKH